MVDRAVHDADVLGVSQDHVGAEQVEGGLEDGTLVRQVLDVEKVGRVDDDLQSRGAQLVKQPGRLGGRIDGWKSRPRVRAGSEAPIICSRNSRELHGTDKAPPDDLPRFFHQLVNNLAGRLDLADQADALARQQTHRIDVSARITVGR